jgi:hypothetical protein
MQQFIPKFIHLDRTKRYNLSCLNCRGVSSKKDLFFADLKIILSRLFSLWKDDIG